MSDELTPYKPQDESIVVYQSKDGALTLEVQIANETVWLSLNQMSSLFGRDKSVISRHIKAIFQEGELPYEGSVAKNATLQKLLFVLSMELILFLRIVMSCRRLNK